MKFVTLLLIFCFQSSEEKDSTEWSSWSPCSHSCGSGLQWQVRGTVKAWKACFLPPCPGSVLPLTDEKCTSYKNSLDEATLSRYPLWESTMSVDSPCSLNCRPLGRLDLVRRLDDIVMDGEKCGKETLSVCVAGKCEEVGCDLKIQSDVKLDKCGVCGGDGSSCLISRFGWRRAALSACSVSCGGGRVVVHYVCKDDRTNQIEENEFCDKRNKPKPLSMECNKFACPARWEISDWSKCDVNCTGIRHRSVQCTTVHIGLRKLVDERDCYGLKPARAQDCSSISCDTWVITHWSKCQPSCGFGQQTRSVTCQDRGGSLSSNCEEEKPPAERQCKEPCFESSDSNKWGRVVDGQYVSVYIDDGGQERTHFSNMTHLAEFLETSNCFIENYNFALLFFSLIFQEVIQSF